MVAAHCACGPTSAGLPSPAPPSPAPTAPHPTSRCRTHSVFPRLSTPPSRPLSPGGARAAAAPPVDCCASAPSTLTKAIDVAFRRPLVRPAAAAHRLRRVRRRRRRRRRRPSPPTSRADRPSPPPTGRPAAAARAEAARRHHRLCRRRRLVAAGRAARPARHAVDRLAALGQRVEREVRRRFLVCRARHHRRGAVLLVLLEKVEHLADLEVEDVRLNPDELPRSPLAICIAPC